MALRRELQVGPDDQVWSEADFTVVDTHLAIELFPMCDCPALSASSLPFPPPLLSLTCQKVLSIFCILYTEMYTVAAPVLDHLICK